MDSATIYKCANTKGKKIVLFQIRKVYGDNYKVFSHISPLKYHIRTVWMWELGQMCAYMQLQQNLLRRH